MTTQIRKDHTSGMDQFLILKSFYCNEYKPAAGEHFEIFKLFLDISGNFSKKVGQ